MYGVTIASSRKISSWKSVLFLENNCGDKIICYNKSISLK